MQFSYSGRAGDEFTVVGRQAGREVDLPDHVNMASFCMPCMEKYYRGGGSQIEVVDKPASFIKTQFHIVHAIFPLVRQSFYPKP